MTEFGLMTIFLAIGGLGFLFLLLSLVVGDVFDMLGLQFDLSLDASHDFGLFDSRVIAIFLTAFGGFGTIGASLGFGAALSSLFGILGGFAFGALVFYFGKFLHNQQASSAVRDEDLIGRTAQVVVGIPAHQIGQIACRVGEERVEKLARTRDGAEIKTGQIVYIEEVTSDGVIVSAEAKRGLSLFSEEK